MTEQSDLRNSIRQATNAIKDAIATADSTLNENASIDDSAQQYCEEIDDLMIYAQILNDIFEVNPERKLPPRIASALSTHHNLHNANKNLNNIENTADIIGIPAPSHQHVRRVREILYYLHSQTPRPYNIYLLTDGQIAIKAESINAEDSITINVSTGGAITCYYNIEGDQNTENYSPADRFPNPDIVNKISHLNSIYPKTLTLSR